MHKREKPISIIGIYPANHVDCTSQDISVGTTVVWTNNDNTGW